MSQPFGGLHVYYGDLHSHCNTGYGHGSAEDAYRNARLQLDFACVTAHAWWGDMPEGRDPRLAPTIDYHRRGFEVTARGWPHLAEVVAANHQPGRFVAFPGFEWHSLAYGDHHVVYGREGGEIIRGADLAEMRAGLRAWAQRGVASLLIPHHIGYRRGYRGINWNAFTPEMSPVVEIMSMHGCSESDDAPYPMLHTMGPRDGASTYQYGLAGGHVVGAIGSTDHHSAHPGSYGSGRAAVWAEELTRAGLLSALAERRCYALTGDNIELRFSVNGAAMGAVLPPAPERRIEVSVIGGSALDTVEILRDNQVIHRWTPPPARPASDGEAVKVCLELGWGPKGEEVSWDAALAVEGGRLLGIEPRLRGQDVVAPQAGEQSSYAFSEWARTGDGLHLATHTWGNPATTTAGTQAVCLTVAGGPATRLVAALNGVPVTLTLGELLAGSRAGYLGDFLTPAYRFQRAVPEHEYTCAFELTDHRDPGVSVPQTDWYTVRVRQANGQWAWSSPVWVQR